MESESVDAQSTTSAEPADAAGEMIPKTEAQKAFERRDKAIAEKRELEAQLASFKQAQADAERQKAEADGDLRKQLEIIAAEKQATLEQFEQLQAELAKERATARKGKIENAITAGVDSSAHDAVLAMFRGISSTLDDGEAEPEVVAKGARKALEKMAPQLFSKQSQAQPTAGLFPSTGTPAPKSTKAIEADMAKRGYAGFRKLL